MSKVYYLELNSTCGTLIQAGPLDSICDSFDVKCPKSLSPVVAEKRIKDMLQKNFTFNLDVNFISKDRFNSLKSRISDSTNSIILR